MAPTQKTDANSGSGPDGLSQTLCPLCGNDNQCAMAAGREPETCWCMEAEFSKEALAKVPEEAVNKVCICPACGRATTDAEQEPGNEG
ncbi:MAG: cysteine-rich CWC family protein [Halioglobus sp.]